MGKTDGTTKKKTRRKPLRQKHLRAWSQRGLIQADHCRQRCRCQTGHRHLQSHRHLQTVPS